jgi:hypothetical protein
LWFWYPGPGIIAPGPTVIGGLAVTTAFCGCQGDVGDDASWCHKMQEEYETCGAKQDKTGHPLYTTASGIESCVSRSLANQGIKTGVGGSFSPGAGIKVNPRPGNCGPIATQGTQTHEQTHKDDYDAKVKQYGKGVADAYRASAGGRVANEVHAYGEEEKFFEDVLSELNAICGPTSRRSTGPTSQPSPEPPGLGPLGAFAPTFCPSGNIP